MERQHRTLKDALYIVSKELDQPWPYIVGQVVSAINAAPNQATKCSPFYAMYGRHFCLDIPQVEKDLSAANALSYGMSLGTQLSRVHKLVKLCADETVEMLDSKSKPVKPVLSFQSPDRKVVLRPCICVILRIALGSSGAYPTASRGPVRVNECFTIVHAIAGFFHNPDGA